MEENKISTLMNIYADKKKELEAIKKETDKINKELKELLLSSGGAHKNDTYLATTTEINNDKIDEDKLIELLKVYYPDTHGSVVKTKEYIDMDELENLLYNRKISADVVNDCIIHNAPTIRLNISKNKQLTD